MITGHCVLILAAAWSAPAASEDFDKRLRRSSGRLPSLRMLEGPTSRR